MRFFLVQSVVMSLISLGGFVYMLDTILKLTNHDTAIPGMLKFQLFYMISLFIYFVSAIILATQSSNLRNYILRRFPKKAEDFRR